MQFDNNIEYYALLIADYNPKVAREIREECTSYEIVRAYWARAIDNGLREIDGK